MIGRDGATKIPRRDAPGPIFLVGAARSGTSLLYKVMALHPGATWLSNWVQHFPTFPQLAALNRCARAFPTRRNPVWFGHDGDNAYVYGGQRPLGDRLFPMPAEAETFYDRCGFPQAWQPAPGRVGPDADRLRRGFDTISRWDGGRTVLTKRIANNRRIQFLSQVFPDARFIEIVRDGRAVAVSLSAVDWWERSTVWWLGGTPQEWRIQGGDPWELCARNWVEEVQVVRRGLVHVDRARVLSLRYEELVRDPASLVEEAIAFCGLDASAPEWRTALAQVRFPNQNERWRTQISTSTQAVIEAFQRSELERYGYA